MDGLLISVRDKKKHSETKNFSVVFVCLVLERFFCSLMRQATVSQKISLLVPKSIAQLITEFAEPDALDWCEILLSQPIEVKIERESSSVVLCRDPGEGSACVTCGACPISTHSTEGRPIAVRLGWRLLSFTAFIHWLRTKKHERVALHRYLVDDAWETEFARQVRIKLRLRCEQELYFQSCSRSRSFFFSDD